MKHPHINLHKAWEMFTKHEKPSMETLNHIALLAGFQSWKELKHAFHEDENIDFSNDDQDGNA